MPFTRASALCTASTVFATIFVGFGINAILRPAHALTFFELVMSPSISAADQNLIEAMTVIYGARDIFIGCAIYVAAFFGKGKSGEKVLGWILLATAAQAVVDGVVCKWMVGDGEWAHWGYAPVVAITGALLIRS
ncbi:putative integral membrane protein [Lindgomyces ingoldianus]|uniref:Integral membrane protein n=1 Tax=Lindgomyces ingoldianus TaxID=673940 RepID=A0ACB6QQZ5_9PLEO|nr:putative integral membrane protein [Lindgomyces ingoldianus]KAF2468515.1 putative integral membrane protein [Lindgomyces ingoldianus]